MSVNMPIDTSQDPTAALARDIVRRALAELRERNMIPSVDLPPVTLMPLAGRRGYWTLIASEITQAAEAANLEHASAETLAASLARYLDETVSLVPAYAEFTNVVSVGEGALEIYLREG